MIHDKICESRKVNFVDFYAEIVWVRLLTKADDNGNYYRDVRRVHANCMLEKAGAGEPETEKALLDLLDVGLITEYKADGRSYIHLSDFHDWQELRTDKNAQIEHPAHPAKFGGAYVGEGLRRDTWVSQEERLKVTTKEPSGNRPVTHREPTGTPKGEVEVEGKEEGEVGRELTSQSLKVFKTVFREVSGAKAKIGGKSGEAFSELYARFGEQALLDAIPRWVADEGGRDAILGDKRKLQWAFANFVREAPEILEAIKAGVFEGTNGDGELPMLRAEF